MTEHNDIKKNTGITEKLVAKSESLGGFWASKNVMNPTRDWISIGAVLFLFIISDLVFDGIMYNRITSGEMYVSVPESEIKVESLHTEKVQSVIADYEARKTSVTNMSPKNSVDPSL